MERQIRPRRSFIFAPALRPEIYPKALASGADIVCVELEDGVAPKDKVEARENAMALFNQPQADDGVERILRINCIRSGFGIADMDAILNTENAPPAIMLPKVNSAQEVQIVDELLSESDLDTRLHIIIETNAGLENVYDIARSSERIDALFFGAVDMSAELRCENTWESLLYARSRIVNAAAGVGVDAIDVPHLDLEDEKGLIRNAERARDMGFSGKGAIHPKQIAAITDVFTPDEASLAHAQKLVDAFEAADTGLVVVDGKLIEKPVLREMKRRLLLGTLRP